MIFDPNASFLAPITLPASVPSGYARQARLEANLRNGFKAYDAQVTR